MSGEKLLKVEKCRKRLASVQRRGALRIACAYRTVSETVVLIIAGVIPIDLIRFERRRTWVVRRAGDGPLMDIRTRGDSGSLARSLGLRETERWTYRLIGQVKVSILRKHGEIDYYLTQFLSGHGQFNAYLHV